MPDDQSKPANNASPAGSNPAPSTTLERLRDFVRREGARYLQDPNLTSIGIGRKIGGGRDGQLCIQFTVGKKMATHPEIESLGSIPIPTEINISGESIPTDVLERTYKPSYQVPVKVARIGQPELDDRVVKLGRTTNVTYGLVRRVDTVAKIDYGEGLVEVIGCFEMGPDPQHPAEEGQISMGGDSGSAWLAAKQNGQVTDVMVGLHLAGEGQGEPDDHALACYAKSVFNKLEITPNPPAAFPGPAPTDGIRISLMSAGAVATGFNESFLSRKVTFPALKHEVQNDAYRLDNSPHIPYTHYSVCLSKSRRMARFVAWNIDGANLKKYSRIGLGPRFDERVPREFQIGNDAYADNKLDRGHIARRADLAWGPPAEAQRGNRDSFYYTNITPQHQRFNESGRAGLWGLLENAIYEDVDVEDLRVSVLAGPAFKESDVEYRGIRLPGEFWKVISFVENGALKAKGFVLSQADLLNDIELLDLDEFRLWQVTLADLGARTSLDFGSLVHADTLALESLTHPELVGVSGRVAREIVRREELFLR
jgi:endonuclease G